MQLDKTHISIRERDMLDILDLSLHVTRAYAWPLLLTMAMGVVPLMVLNHFLIGWMADLEYREETPIRFFWSMMLLIFIQAPLASIFATSFLGQVVFLERPVFKNVISDVFRLLPRIAWSQLLMRGVGAAVLLMLLVERYGFFNPGVEAFLLPCLAIYAVIIRATRPFMNEIVLLERNPLRSKNRTAMTVGRRSSLLHGPSTGDLFLRWGGTAIFGILLMLGTFGVFRFFYGVFWNNWARGIFPDRFTLELLLPLSMWLTVGLMTVVRFLGYLDTRIRQEGWEVELTMRAEATRLTSKLT